MKEVLVLLWMKHPDFQPVVPSMAGKHPNRHAPMKAIRPGEVGVVQVNRTAACKNMVIDWSFVFPLEKFENFQYEHVKNENENELFGYVVHDQMMESVVMLSSIRSADRQEYTITIESR